MGSIEKSANGLDVPELLLKQLSACLPQESYNRCVEYLRQSDCGSVLVVLQAEEIEADVEYQDAKANVRIKDISFRQMRRNAKRFQTAVMQSAGISKAIASLIQHVRTASISDPLVNAVLGI
jgi:hypothetical protein